jgi:hypothetical protein
MRPSGRRTIAATFGRSFGFCIAAKVRSRTLPLDFRKSKTSVEASGYAPLPLMLE